MGNSVAVNVGLMNLTIRHVNSKGLSMRVEIEICHELFITVSINNLKVLFAKKKHLVWPVSFIFIGHFV